MAAAPVESRVFTIGRSNFLESVGHTGNTSDLHFKVFDGFTSSATVAEEHHRDRSAVVQHISPEVSAR